MSQGLFIAGELYLTLYDGFVDLIAAKIYILLLELMPTLDSLIILNYVR